MQSNRLRFEITDESVSVGLPSAMTGLAVVKAPKGTTTPIYFPRNSADAIKSRIGEPTPTYPGIREILEFNQNYNIWVSAPEANLERYPNYYGGIYFVSPGLIKPFYQVTDPENPNFIVEGVYGQNTILDSGVTASVTGIGSVAELVTSALPTNYTPVHVTISYPGRPGEIGVAVPSRSATFRIAETQSTWDIMTPETESKKVGSIDKASRELRIGTSENTVNPYVKVVNWQDDAVLRSYVQSGPQGGLPPGFTIKWGVNIRSDVLMTLYQTSPRSIGTSLTVLDVDTSGGLLSNTVKFTYNEKAYGNVYRTKTFTVSPDFYKVDGFNSSLYIEDILSDDYFISGKAYGDFSSDQSWSSIVPTSNITVVGQRAMSDANLEAGELASALNEGWIAAKSPSFSSINLFFDPEANDAVKTTFSNMRDSTFKFATYISGVKSTGNTVQSIIEKASAFPKKTGLAYYVNEFLVQEGPYKFWTIPIGAVASMLCRIMEVKLGGAAPMFVNTSEGLGGQISSSVLKQMYDFTADELDDLDAASLNPIIKDTTYGLMITSQRTAQDPTMLTDWSKLGHQMAFDLFRAEVKDNVMIPQIGKPIDATYMRLRREQTEIILAKRLVGPTAIWDSGRVLVEEVNTAETKAQNKFVIKVRVKVNPFSEYVELIFNNVGQLTTV